MINKPTGRNPRSLDPTADDMRSYLQTGYPELDEFDIEEAIYWFAVNYHDGQGSNLYSALSTSQFRPSPLAHGPSSDYAYKLLQDYFTEQWSY